MVSGQVWSLPQHHLDYFPHTVMVLLLLATRYAGHCCKYELVLNDVWRYFDSSDDILCPQGEARVYGSCTADEERVREGRMLSMSFTLSLSWRVHSIQTMYLEHNEPHEV